MARDIVILIIRLEKDIAMILSFQKHKNHYGW